MTYIIKQGKHRAKPLRFGLYLSKKVIARKVLFDTSCKYFIAGEDMQDINKLFGIGYLPNHHEESARFGWRYNENLNKIELFSYCYVNGLRTVEFITTLSFNQYFFLEITIKDDCYRFKVKKDGFEINTEVRRYNTGKIGYPLGIYFGGNQPAPHNIKIEMKKA